MHAEHADAPGGENSPARQPKQLDDSEALVAAENRPAGQSTHAGELPIAWNMPAGQSVQVLADRPEYFPTGQLAHSLERAVPVRLWYNPGSQSVHSAEWGPENLPNGQAAQFVPMEEEYLPASHSSQATEPEEEENFPELHSTQIDDPEL